MPLAEATTFRLPCFAKDLNTEALHLRCFEGETNTKVQWTFCVDRCILDPLESGQESKRDGEGAASCWLKRLDQTGYKGMTRAPAAKDCTVFMKNP